MNGAEHWMRMADQRMTEGDPRAALEIYDRAIEADPKNARAYYQRGWAKAMLGDLAGEFEDWSKALELDPNFAEAYAARAAARTGQGDVQGSASDLQQAMRLDPSHRNVWEPLLRRFRERIEQSEEVTSLAGLGTDRRAFLKAIAGVAAATVALSGCHLKASGKEGKVRWGMIIDLKRCIACRACAISCKNENKTPPGVAYMVVLEEEHGQYPNVSRPYAPRPCMQCVRSSCTLVCPTGATYHRPDGIVAIDYEKCIGCRYCIAACPYGARSFDYGYDYIGDPANPYNAIPSSEYGARYGVRQRGKSPQWNVRKCTFCLHLQDENGMYREPPACARTCMGRAIHFGDLNDPQGTCIVHGERMQELLARRNHKRLKEELGNEPSVYYLL